MLRIGILGMGYVGCVTAGCLASQGHTIFGFDIDPAKCALLKQGLSPIAEPGLGELLAQAVKTKHLQMAASIKEAVAQTEMSIVCVSTPSKPDGNIDSRYIVDVCRAIGEALADKQAFHVVVIRSTVLPGMMKDTIIRILERHSDKKAGVDFGVCNNPEFMREAVAVQDFLHPPKIVIGETDASSGDLVASLYDKCDAEIIRCPVEVGEMVKYADNAFHALKVSFANEIGRLCKSAGIDSHQVMDIFCKDTTLNLSPYYLKPGFAFGGSCLPKDLRALNYMADALAVQTPLLASVIESNAVQVAWGLQMILARQKRKIGFLGVSFKAGTDDIRESPVLEIMARLAEQDVELYFYEPEFKNAVFPSLTKANPVGSLDALLEIAEVIVISNNAPEFATVAGKLSAQQVVIDFVRIAAIETAHANYFGICW